MSPGNIYSQYKYITYVFTLASRDQTREKRLRKAQNVQNVTVRECDMTVGGSSDPIDCTNRCIWVIRTKHQGRTFFV